MKEYIISILVISIICFVARELLSTSNMAKHISFISGLCIFTVAIMPLISVIDGISDISFDEMLNGEEVATEYESVFDSYIENAEIDLIKRDIRADLAKRFSLDESELKINIKYDYRSEARLERVSVTLLGRAVFADSNAIKSYLDSRLSCETVVIVGG